MLPRVWLLQSHPVPMIARNVKKGAMVARVFRGILFTVLLALVAVLTVWSVLALWYRLPAPELLRYGAGGLATVIGLGVIAALFTSKRRRALAIFTALIAMMGVWWSTIEPFSNANWAPDMARQVTGQIDGDILTLTDVRDFKWRSATDFTENWATRQYDLSTLTSLDMVMSYWAGPEMAHFIFSFGFADGRFLAWSVEVRRQIGGGFSPIGDFFKSNTLAIVASEESDVMGVRTNIRFEDVLVFRLNTSPENIRNLLEEYVVDANALSKQPEFFNSLTSNCTTTVFRMMKAIGDTAPFDWRLIVNGYLPEYAHDRGALDTDYSVSDLRRLGQINARAIATGLNDSYSTAIRVGIPPLQ